MREHELRGNRGKLRPIIDAINAVSNATPIVDAASDQQREAMRSVSSMRPSMSNTTALRQAQRDAARASDEPAAAHAITRRAQAAQSLRGMRVRDRAGERVGGVRRRRAGKVEQPANHFLHLLLRGLAVADDRLLHLQRRVFGDRAGRASTAAEIAAPRACPSSSVDCGLTLTKTFSTATSVGRCCAITVARSRRITPRRSGSSPSPVRMQPHVDAHEPAADELDDAEPGHAQAGIDAEDAARGCAKGARD